MRHPKKKRTISLAQHRKRKRTIGFATALACVAFCAERMAAALGRMGSSALEVGGFYNTSHDGQTLPSRECVVKTKELLCKMPKASNVARVNASMKDILKQKAQLLTQ